jgi:UDP:flavonoid glycosyltransferase YjiC (YdhE family)
MGECFMKTLVFAVAGYNLAETSRMIEIAKETRKYFKIIFISYGGQFEYLIDELKFERKKLEPQLTDKKLADLKKVLNGDKINTTSYFNKKEIESRVKSEIEILKEIKPVALLTGWNLTVCLSCRILKIQFINVLHSTSIKEYYENGLQSHPDRIDSKLLKKIINYEKLDKLFNKRVLTTEITVKSYNRVGKKYGLNKFKNFLDMIEGDKVFLADVPEWVNYDTIRSNIYHIGPLPAKFNNEIPKSITDLHKNKPIVYFAMGSSGKSSLIIDIIKGFSNKPYNVIAPVLSHLKGLKYKKPDNVIITDFISADKVNALADVAVIHGGQNTVMNACLSKTPFVGIGMHVEQQANIDACVRKGFAIRLSKKYVTAKDVLESIDILLGSEEAKKNISVFSE